MYKTLYRKNGYELVLFLPRHRVRRIKSPFLKRIKDWLISMFPASEQIRSRGTASLSHYDDRTKREKFNDKMREIIYYFDNLAFSRKNEQAKKRSRLYIKRMNFMSFFDTTNSEKVTSMEQIKVRERAGQVMLTHREAQEEFKRQKKYKEEAFDRKSTEQFKELYVQMHQGRKFSKEFKNRVDYNNKNLQELVK